MTNDRTMTRSFKNEKRRRNNRIILYLVIAALLFLILLFVLILNNDKEEVTSNEPEDNQSESIAKEDPNEQIEADAKEREDEILNELETDVIDNTEEAQQVPYELDDALIETFANIERQVLQSNDENVIEIYVADWPPIGTKQKGPHTTNYEDDSPDRIEIRQAVLLVTNIAEENLIEHWIGNGGEQKVIATVEDRSKNEFYRVYLTWIDDVGWKATKVEKLKEYEQ